MVQSHRFARAVLAVLLAAAGQPAAASAELPFTRHVAGSTAIVGHRAWNSLLQKYVVASPDGIDRVRYAAWKRESHAELKAYVNSLEEVDVARLDRPEQFAFWVNLYNAKTIEIVLDRYPVKSIKDIRLGGGVIATVAGGPWKAKVATVSGVALSLDDIEHAILRGLFRDARVHYAVNCGSIGCPNLGREAFTGAALESQLEAAARAYVNSPRGVRWSGDRLVASSIFRWFQSDFGGDAAGVLAHLARYAEPALKARLSRATTIDEYSYDWSLNDVGR